MANASQYIVSILFQGKDQTGQAAKSASGGMDALSKSIGGAIAGYLSLRTAQAAIDFAKFGASVGRASSAFDSLAKSAGTSGDEIISAIDKASDFTIDRMTAMEVANRAMLMGVADSPAEFERLTEVAVKLGRAMGKDAKSSIDDFVTAAGRQSKMIADNLGLMVDAEGANKRYADALGKTVDELTDAERKEAFRNEMLTQGEAKVANLGDATLGAAESFEQLTKAFTDAKSAMAQGFAEELGKAVGDASELASMGEDIGKVFGTIAKVMLWLNPGTGGRLFGQWVADQIDQIGGSAKNRARDIEYLVNTEVALIDEERRLEAQLKGASIPAMERASQTFVEAGESAYNYGDSLDELTDREGDAASSVAFQKHLEDIDQAARDARATLMDMAADYTDYQRDIADDAKDYAKDLEKIEQEHQDNLAGIQKKGQSYSIKIDEAAEWEKLALLEERLEIALQSQSEFTDKTKESTRMAKDLQIRQLQGQIAEQTKLLDDYNAGRLVKQGQNISGLLSAEEARYQEELALLEKSRLEQEAEQQRSLGQMVLRQFEAWAAMNNISADAMLDMSLAIQEKYGLITEAGAAEARLQADMWAMAFDESGRKASGFFDLVVARMNAIPSEKTITIKYRQDSSGLGIGSDPLDPTHTGMQHGGRSSGGMTWVGERGAELVRLPPGSHVYNAQQSRTINNHYNLSVSSMQQSRGIALDFATLRAMGG